MYEKTINGTIPIHLLSNVPNDENGKDVITVSYTHLTLPTNREV